MKARFKAKKCFLKAALFLILKGKKIRKLFKKQGFWYFVTRVLRENNIIFCPIYKLNFATLLF